MKVSLGTIVNDFKKRSIRRRRMISLVTALSMFIASGVVWELRSTGITMVNDVGCGIEEHTHGESCYSHEFICDKEESSDSDGTGHVHDVSCFEEHLSCELEEHRHTVECYDNEEEYLLLNQVDEPEEMPVVEFDPECVVNSDTADDTEAETSEETEDENDVSDGEDENEEDTQDDEFLSESDLLSVGLFRRPNMAGLTALALITSDAADNTAVRNTVYKVNSDNSIETLNTQNINGTEYIIMKTGETLAFGIYTSANCGEYFYSRDENDNRITDSNKGAVYSKNRGARTFNNGQSRFLAVDVNARRPGTAKLCFYDDDAKKSSDIMIMVIPELNKMYVVSDDDDETPNSTKDNDSDRYAMTVGETIKLCIYTKRSGTYDSKNNRTWMYVPALKNSNNDDVSAEKYGIKRSSANPDETGTYNPYYKETIYRFYAEISAGTGEISFSNLDFKVAYWNSNDVNDAYYVRLHSDFSARIELVKPDGSTETDLSGYTESNPFNVAVGQKFDLYGYDVTSSREWFYCSFDSDKTETVTLNYNNELDSGYSSGRKVKATFTATQPTLKKDSSGNVISNKPTKINFSGQSFYIKVNSSEEGTDKIYVITALGEREKDKITETFDANNPYQPNLPRDGNNQGGNPYLIWLNETVEICFYSSGNSNDLFEYEGDHSGIEFIENKYDQVAVPAVSESCYFTKDVGVSNSEFKITGDISDDKGNMSYNGQTFTDSLKFDSKGTLKFKASGPGTLTLVAKTRPGTEGVGKLKINGSEAITNITETGGEYKYIIPAAGDYTISQGEKEVHVYYAEFKTAGGSSGLNRNYAKIKGIEDGNYAVKHSLSNGKYEIFYITVVGSEGNMRTHADIEITDGGFYEFRNEVEDTANGEKTVTIERYDTHVTGVNHCYLYGADGGVIQHYVPLNYEARGAVGSTQYELTSAYYNGAQGREQYHYLRGSVKSARFDVSVSLIPSTRTVTVIDSKDDSVKSTKVTDISENVPIQIPSAVFNLNLRSVIDAVNKCPQHNGLDFNVSACLNTITTNVEFKASKKFIGNDNKPLDVFNRTYTFELVDQNDNVVSTAENDSTGKIVFGNVLLSEGTYRYTVREQIPKNAMEIAGKKYQQGSPSDSKGVFYDQNNVQYKVVVSNTTGIVESSYYKVVGNSETSINNFTDAFNNEVVDEEYQDITLKKIWSDGNANHTGDYIEFYIYQTIGNGERTRVVLAQNEIRQNNAVLYKDGRFYVGSDQNWEIKLEKFPVQLGGYSCTYELEELNTPDGYSPSYDTRGTDWSITNVTKDNISITIEKKWLNPQGEQIYEAEGRWINFNLYREVRDVKVPVKIQIKDFNGTVTKEETVDARVGGTVKFTVNASQNSDLRISETSNCDCSKSGNNFTVSNIRGKSTVVLTSCDVVYRETFNNDTLYNGWKGRTSENMTTMVEGVLRTVPEGDKSNDYHFFEFGNDYVRFNHGYSTKYFNNSENRTLHVSDRIGKDTGAYYDLSELIKSGKIIKGNTYKFIAYVLATPDFSPVMTRLQSNNSGDKPLAWTDQNFKFTVEDTNSNNTKKLTAEFTIPQSNDFKLFITTSGKADFYIDEVIIANTGLDIDVTQSDGFLRPVNANVLNETYAINITDNDVGSMNTNWVFDCYIKNNEQLVMHDKVQKVTYDAETLKSILNTMQKNLYDDGKEYRYVVEEVQRLTGYEEPEYSNNGVASNTPETPMVIINKQIKTYYLPATGGTGPEKIQRTGLILIFFASAGFILRRRIKRRSG